MPVHATPALGQTDIHPVGRLIAGAYESCGIDESFQKNRAIPVAFLPVISNPVSCQCQRFRGQVLATYPGKNEKSSLVYDEMKARLPFFRRPADKDIPWRHFPRSPTESHGTQIPVAGLNKISDLRPLHGPISQIMVPANILIPQRVACLTRERLKPQIPKILNRKFDRKFGIACRTLKR